MIYCSEDKNNENINRAMMGRFRRFVNDLELKEIPLLGRRYTWSNGRDSPTLVKLDRVLCTNDWEEIYVDNVLQSHATVAKMAFHAIFQYNVLAIDDTHNTWTNVIVKMTILRLLGSSDDKEKEKIGVARPKGPPLRGFRYPVSGRGSRGSRPSRVSGQRPET